MQEASAEPGLTVPESAYLVCGRRFELRSPGFAQAIAATYAARRRPRCLCRVDGIEMYVAQLGNGFIVKRMPNTGSHHAPDCPSYEPPPELSGLGQILGSAITEDPATGRTTLKLDFALSKITGRSIRPQSGDSTSVATNGTRLSLRGLLHYLWEQAGLTRWQPGFAGRRSWATVRKHLLQAAESKMARGHPLQSRLYIPEVFSVEQRGAINARRLAQWASTVAKTGKRQQLMLLIAEVKEIVPARHGHKALVKHMPDQAFVLDEQLYRRLDRVFESELSLWGVADNLHMVMIATFGVSAAGIPAVAELSLMPVTAQWLPIEDSFERQLVDRLVGDGRSFVKVLRYNLPRGRRVASAVLTDAGESPLALCIVARADDQAQSSAIDDLGSAEAAPPWIWHPAQGTMPSLPAPRAPLH